MEFLSRGLAREVGRKARKRHDVDIPEIGYRVGLLEPTGLQRQLAPSLLPNGTVPYESMMAILPAVVVDEDGEPLYPGSELIAELPGSVIEALMREWLVAWGLGGVAEPPALSNSVGDQDAPFVDFDAKRRGIEADLRANGLIA